MYFNNFPNVCSYDVFGIFFLLIKTTQHGKTYAAPEICPRYGTLIYTESRKGLLCALVDLLQEVLGYLP